MGTIELLHAVTLDRVSVRQGSADIFTNSTVAELPSYVRQLTGNRE